jgi:hypothetical protein
MGFIKTIDAIDKSISRVYHTATSKVVEFALLPSGYIHNGMPGALILGALIYFYITEENAKL